MRVIHAAEMCGIRGMLVHAISVEAKAFCLRLGLETSPLEAMTLMTTVADLRAALGWAVPVALGAAVKGRHPRDEGLTARGGGSQRSGPLWWWPCNESKKEGPSMTTKNIRRAVLCAFGASAMLFAGATQAALQDRDLNGDTVVDAFYDTDLDITWLRNAFVTAGDRDQAADSVASFSFGGYSDWRLPTSDYCSDFNCTGSEMGHLWYVELGNIAGGPMNNAGDFQNLGSGYYWSGTELPPPMSAWAMYFHTGVGIQASFHKSNAAAAMAVRPGDVAAIPEPETLALMLGGLAGLALARRRLGA